MTDLTVVATNLSHGIALMSDDTVSPIVSMFDCEGELTSDWHAATACVVKHAEDSWFAVSCRDHISVATH